MSISTRSPTLPVPDAERLQYSTLRNALHPDKLYLVMLHPGTLHPCLVAAVVLSMYSSAQIRDEYESVKDMPPPEQAAAKRAAVVNGAAPSLGGATEVTTAAEDTAAGRSSTARMLDNIAAERARCALCSSDSPQPTYLFWYVLWLHLGNHQGDKHAVLH